MDHLCTRCMSSRCTMLHRPGLPECREYAAILARYARPDRKATR